MVGRFGVWTVTALLGTLVLVGCGSDATKQNTPTPAARAVNTVVPTVIRSTPIRASGGGSPSAATHPAAASPKAEASPKAASPVASPIAASPAPSTPRAAASPSAATPVASPRAGSPVASPIAANASIALGLEDIKFSTDAMAIPANTDVVIHITNTGASMHNFSIDALKIDVGTVAPGASVDVKINAPAGTYTYYCKVPGHAAAGMKGTLTVK